MNSQFAFRPSSSFRIEKRSLPAADPQWQTHGEIELALVVSGEGQLLTDRSIRSTGPGDIFLLGPHVPHTWRIESPAPSGAGAELIFIYVREIAFGIDGTSAPELLSLRDLIQNAAGGMHLSGPHARHAALEMTQLETFSGPPAFARLLLIFDHLARSHQQNLAEGSPPTASSLRSRDGRLARVSEYLRERFRDPISLAEIARCASMSPSAFSRYFKQAAGRNVSDHLQELRVNYAAVRLIASDEKIGDIALDSGFGTLSSFNRQFRRLRGIQPRRYRDDFRRGCDSRSEGAAGSGSNWGQTQLRFEHALHS